MASRLPNKNDAADAEAICEDMGLWITALITVISTVSLVYGPSGKARKHSELARDHKRLESDIVGAGADLKMEQIVKFDAQFLKIESSEPAALGALVTQCHNELSVAIGQRDQVTRLPLIQRAFKNWFDFDQSLGMHVERPTLAHFVIHNSPQPEARVRT